MYTPFKTEMKPQTLIQHVFPNCARQIRNVPWKSFFIHSNNMVTAVSLHSEHVLISCDLMEHSSLSALLVFAGFAAHLLSLCKITAET